MSKTKILYVEDETFLGKIVKESLESRGFEVVMESDGNKVLTLFGRQQGPVMQDFFCCQKGEQRRFVSHPFLTKNTTCTTTTISMNRQIPT